MFDAPSRWGEDFLLGVLPMVNVLGVGLLVAQQRPKPRPFLLGFETFGAAALALYVTLMILLTDPWGASTTYGDLILRYLNLVGAHIETAIGPDRPFLLNSVLGARDRCHARLAATGRRPDRWIAFP